MSTHPPDDLTREMSRMWRTAAVELLMREYRWRPEAAERFASQLALEVVEMATRAAELQRVLDKRRARRERRARLQQQRMQADSQEQI